MPDINPSDYERIPVRDLQKGDRFYVHVVTAGGDWIFLGP